MSPEELRKHNGTPRSFLELGRSYTTEVTTKLIGTSGANEEQSGDHPTPGIPEEWNTTRITPPLGGENRNWGDPLPAESVPEITPERVNPQDDSFIFPPRDLQPNNPLGSGAPGYGVRTQGVQPPVGKVDLALGGALDENPLQKTNGAPDNPVVNLSGKIKTIR